MIHVLAGNREEAEAWRERTGLAPRNVVYLGSGNACRGRQLHPRGLVILGSFDDRPDRELIIHSLLPALYPHDLSRVHRINLTSKEDT